MSGSRRAVGEIAPPSQKPLTDTELVILANASCDAFGRIVVPEHNRNGDETKVLKRLIAKKLIEIDTDRMSRERPPLDPDASVQIYYRITAVGLKAIGLGQDGQAATPQNDTKTAPAQFSQTLQICQNVQIFAPKGKIAELAALLEADHGATLSEITARLGWQPHTVRAAISRLRQSGVAITTDRIAGADTRYRITPHLATTRNGEV